MSIAGRQARVDLASIARVGQGLQRPECVLATHGGDLYTADWRGGIAHLRPDGGQALYRAELAVDRPARPNGIALRRNGSFLFADLGTDAGGVFSLARDGSIRPFLVEVDGVALPPTNFVFEDAKGRVWVTVSTRLAPSARAYRREGADGSVVLFAITAASVVASGVGTPNQHTLGGRRGEQGWRFPIEADDLPEQEEVRRPDQIAPLREEPVGAAAAVLEAGLPARHRE